jgi:hypothetical protein
VISLPGSSTVRADEDRHGHVALAMSTTTAKRPRLLRLNTLTVVRTKEE